MEFFEEIQNYTEEELELIISTQTDLYSEAEMVELKKLLEVRKREKKAAHDALIISRLPETITCEKCDGPNPFSNEQCQFCGYSLDKSKYYTDEYYEQLEQARLREQTQPSSESSDTYAFHYIISFLIPLAGLVLGATMLPGDNIEKTSCGKSCIVISVFSCAVYAILLGVL